MIEPIGIIHSPYTSLEDMPIQPRGAQGVEGTVILDSRYREGLDDLEGFSHIYLLYRFHMAARTSLKVVPFMDVTPRGVFSTRSPLRPNHIGISIVNLVRVEENVLHVKNIDILDNTPLLDIKPYITAFDSVTASRSGWMKGSEKDVTEKRSDGRFL